MKSFTEFIVLLTLVCWTNAVVGKSNLYTGWTTKYLDNTPYQAQEAQVGDTITFIWTENERQNVFIHPTNDCNQTGRIPVGDESPTTYTFTSDDASPDGNEVFFACDIDDRCENHGMRLTVTVFPASERDATLVPAPVSAPVDSAEAETVSPITSLTATPTIATVSTQIPSVVPFSAPVAAPVIAPIAAPITTVPTEQPSSPATESSTETPVSPTLEPVAPTLQPVEPTFEPVVPTLQPVMSEPSVPPTPLSTEKPSPNPTSAPTTTQETPVPTRMPTEIPTPSPTEFPTTPPVPFPTNKPTLLPTLEPTISPTGVPSNAKDEPASDQTKKMRGLQMTIEGIASFSGETKSSWEETTEIFSTSHYKSDFPESSFTTTITATNAQEITRRDRELMIRGVNRELQTQPTTSFIITYNQEVSYDSTDSDITENYLAKSAFASPQQRDEYVLSLQNSGDLVLETATGVTKPSFVSDLVPTTAPNPIDGPTQPPTKNEPALSTAAIIGIACGGGALLIIIIIFLIYCSKKKSKDNENVETTPPPLSVSLKEDEVSTLAGPSITGPPQLQGDRSVGTVDYDYTKAYGNGDTSISSAGGTFGSNTQNISLPANAGATGAALGPYDDDDSYEARFRNSKNNVKEEILHIFAPPGKLGVVIDTPDDGAPVVHAVKDSSVVVDKVQVGDKLVAVDDEDVRTLTAIKVSKLISRKSANPSRKLTILRTTVIE